jgi:hypothetical protein
MVKWAECDWSSTQRRGYELLVYNRLAKRKTSRHFWLHYSTGRHHQHQYISKIRRKRKLCAEDSIQRKLVFFVFLPVLNLNDKTRANKIPKNLSNNTSWIRSPTHTRPTCLSVWSEKQGRDFTQSNLKVFRLLHFFIFQTFVLPLLTRFPFALVSFTLVVVLFCF